ncbi:MAG: hypothetical protein IT495_05360, partial [Gammaproteobacteria bacterium]|nr:hypothetical protein [Gammaproteobacteria bacterium]
AAAPTAADTLRAQVAAEPACEVPASEADRRAQAQALGVQTWDAAAMACAGEQWYALAQAQPQDAGVQVEALAFFDTQLYFLRVEEAADLMGVNLDNRRRLEQAGARYVALAGAASQRFADDPRVLVHKALAARVTGGAYDAELLQQVIASHPDTLAGRAQLALGRMLYELPSILGGSAEAAVPLLEQARALNPGDMRALYYLAEAFDEELEEAKALEAMRAMLAIEPAAGEQQIAADMLRLAVGLSRRLGDAALSGSLAARRDALLAANPRLLTRASIAVGGHGGANPLDPK